MEKSVYNFQAVQFNGKTKLLSDYKGKVLLIVNIASGCYFRRQFKTLEKLYQKYNSEGLEILAFPSNNFLNQEPRTGRRLEVFCRVSQQVTFPVFKRVHVIGDYIDPLYSYLSDKNMNGVINSKPQWNFHKYLIDKNGRVVDFFYPTTSPFSARVKQKVQQLLDE